MPAPERGGAAYELRGVIGARPSRADIINQKEKRGCVYRMEVSEMAKYKCDECGREFEEMSDDGFCPCGGILLRVEEPKVKGLVEEPKVEGECGLGILVLDFSGSMTEKAFSEERYPEFPQRKIDLVAHALGSALPSMRSISKAEYAYVALIGFANDAKLIEIKKAPEIKEDAKYWRNWTYKKQEEILEELGNGTNISRALEVAYDVYDAALNGKMDKYGIKEFAPMYHDIDIAGKIVKVANVRVFLYSDGEHIESYYGPLINHFENATLIPGESNVSGLMTAYFGLPNTEGYRTLEDIAGVCPIHKVKGVMHINSPERYKLLRKIFHMASAASGFCAECAKYI